MGFSAASQAGGAHRHQDYARVTDVRPIYRTVTDKIPEQQCRVETVQTTRDVGGSRSPAGTIIGGVVGAAVGNSLGRDLGHNTRDKQVGTVAGAIVGAVIGHTISSARQQVVTGIENVEQCRTQYRYVQHQELVGYDVGYRYQGQHYRTQTDQHPGKRIRVAVNVRPVRY